MPNNISNTLIAELFAPQSSDPFLTLVTLEHDDIVTPIRLVNNKENIISNGDTFTAFPMKITLAPDDGESSREFMITFDNVSLEIIGQLRSVTTPLTVKLEMILASDPDTIQMSQEELKIFNISYNNKTITGRLLLDNFLNTEMTSEKYTPSNFPGIF